VKLTWQFSSWQKYRRDIGPRRGIASGEVAPRAVKAGVGPERVSRLGKLHVEFEMDGGPACSLSILGPSSPVKTGTFEPKLGRGRKEAGVELVKSPAGRVTGDWESEMGTCVSNRASTLFMTRVGLMVIAGSWMPTQPGIVRR